MKTKCIIVTLSLLISGLLFPGAAGGQVGFPDAGGSQSILYVHWTAADGGNGLSWSMAFNDLQQAIMVAYAANTMMPGTFTEIRVARGVPSVCCTSGIIGVNLDLQDIVTTAQRPAVSRSKSGNRSGGFRPFVRSAPLQKV